MIRITVPVLILVSLSVFYLILSGGPPRVHLLAVTCFALGFGVPALLTGSLVALRRRAIFCVLFMLLSMLLWDGAAHLVILNIEGAFYILSTRPWLYVVGFIALYMMVCLSTVMVMAIERLRPINSEKTT